MKLKKNECSKDIKGFEGLYAVTTLGRVWSCRRKIWLKPGIEGNGYKFVALCLFGKAKDKKVHCLVAGAFVPDPHDEINYSSNLIHIWINKGNRPRSVPMTKRVAAIFKKRQTDDQLKDSTNP